MTFEEFERLLNKREVMTFGEFKKQLKHESVELPSKALVQVELRKGPGKMPWLKSSGIGNLKPQKGADLENDQIIAPLAGNTGRGVG